MVLIGVRFHIDGDLDMRLLDVPIFEQAYELAIWPKHQLGIAGYIQSWCLPVTTFLFGRAADLIGVDLQAKVDEFSGDGGIV
jgi:hypothetical protein